MAQRCKCMENLEVIEGINAFANQTVGETLETWDGVCVELYSKVIDHVVARLVHTLVLHLDKDVSEKDVPDHVHRAVGEMQGRLPAIIAGVIADYNRKEKGNASH